MRPFRILIVDDEDSARALIEAVLSSTTLELEQCSSAEEAIRRCSSGLPDLAVVDLQMPGMNGIEFCQWIKHQAHAAFVPVMLLTCRNELEDKVTGLNSGADDYLTKPFAAEELLARIRALLRIKLVTDELRETQQVLAHRERELVAIQVAGAAAHELGQPLTTLLLNCELVQQQQQFLGSTRKPDLEQHRAQIGKLLQSIVEQCTRMRLILARLNQVREYKTKPYLTNPRLDIRILDLPPDSHSNVTDIGDNRSE